MCSSVFYNTLWTTDTVTGYWDFSSMKIAFYSFYGNTIFEIIFCIILVLCSYFDSTLTSMKAIEDDLGMKKFIIILFHRSFFILNFAVFFFIINASISKYNIFWYAFESRLVVPRITQIFVVVQPSSVSLAKTVNVSITLTFAKLNHDLLFPEESRNFIVNFCFPLIFF